MIALLLIGVLLQAAPRPKTHPPTPSADQTTRVDTNALMTRVGEALSRGDRAEAKRLLSEAGERGHSVRALMQLARLYAEEGNANGAAGALRSGLALAPNSEDVLASFAELSLTVHAPVQAILTLESLTRLCPTEPRYAYQLGVGLMMAGDMPAATDALRRANTLDPDRPLTLLALGLAYNHQKLYTDARPLLRRALDLDPESLETLAALSEAEAGTGDLASAERDASRALSRAGSNATANLVIGMVRMAQQRYPEARDALLAAATADPRSPKPEYQLSLVFSRLGDQASADQHLAQYREKLRALEAAVEALHKHSRGAKR
jgi:tetratricopeptide (TPR) repeat protein